MPATIHAFREAEAHKHIAEVTRVARELYDEKRDLIALEQVFLSAVHEIGERFTGYCGTAAREHGFDSDAAKAVRSMAERQKAKELWAVLAIYKAERERFFNDNDEKPVFDDIEAALRVAMAAAE